MTFATDKSKYPQLMDFLIISLYIILLWKGICSESFKDVHSYKTKSL